MGIQPCVLCGDCYSALQSLGVLDVIGKFSLLTGYGFYHTSGILTTLVHLIEQRILVPCTIVNGYQTLDGTWSNGIILIAMAY